MRTGGGDRYAILPPANMLSSLGDASEVLPIPAHSIKETRAKPSLDASHFALRLALGMKAGQFCYDLFYFSWRESIVLLNILSIDWNDNWEGVF